jgi:hypothetical protein
LRELLEESDPARRIWIGAQGGADDHVLARLITAAIAACPSKVDQISLAVVLSRAFAERDLTPAAWSPISDLVDPVLVPRDEVHRVLPGTELGVVREIKAFIAQNDCDDLDRAFLYGIDTDFFALVSDWRDVFTRFRLLRELFGVSQ